MNKLKVSVIIPCYNEEKNIATCVKRIKIPYEHEIIVVDDGSEDDTTKVAKTVKGDNVKVIRYEKNRGKGNAVRVGIENSNWDIIVIQDADMATPPEELEQIVKPIIDGDADFVNGSRFIYPMERGAMKSLHVFGNKIFSATMSLLIGVKFTDTLCGFKAFNLRKFKNFELRERSWPDFELLFKAKKSGLKIIEVPIHYKQRRGGKSKMKTFRHGLNLSKIFVKNFIDLYF